VQPIDKVKVKASSSTFVPIILTPKEAFLILNELPLLQRMIGCFGRGDRYPLQRNCEAPVAGCGLGKQL
jgi:hypothetical protein